jgi:REP element-mobilizing transposase RayT
MHEGDLLHARTSPRAPGFDYATPGAYFVTIATQNRSALFGRVTETMMLNPAGRTVADWWRKLPTKFAAIRLDEFTVMPNHLHAVIWIDETDEDQRVSIPRVIGWFKTMTTNEYIRRVRDDGWPPFDKRLWQRSYYDHVVRGDDDLSAIRQYIIDNPRKWAEDRENPDAQRGR